MQGGAAAPDGAADHAFPEHPELSSGLEGTSPVAQQAGATAAAEPAAGAEPEAGNATAAGGTTHTAVDRHSRPAPRRASLGGMPCKEAKIVYAEKPGPKGGSRRMKKRHGKVLGKGTDVTCEVVVRFDDSEEAEIVTLDKVRGNFEWHLAMV